MESKFIKLKSGIQLHSIQSGSGPLVLMLHGYPDFWYTWRNQINFFSSQFKVVAIDMRGYNLSDKPSSLGEYAIPKLAADINDTIEALGYEKAFVLGHDWGGAVAWAFASLFPNRMEKLAILNMPHPLEMRRAFMEFNWKQIKRSWYIFFFQLPYLPEQFMKKKGFFHKTFKSLLANKAAYKKEEMPEYEKAFSDIKAIKGSLAYYRSAFRELLAPGKITWAPIECPVLVLWGEKDKALGKELTLNTQSYCKNSLEIKYDPGSGHFIQLDNPEFVNKNVLNFFNS